MATPQAPLTARDAHQGFLAALAALIGPSHVLTSPDAAPGSPDPLASYLSDWRGRYQGQALAVALPADTVEVTQVVRLCAQHGVGIVPQGGNTSLVGGAVPDNSGHQVLLSLKRLNQVLAVDSANQSMTVQAGCVLAHIHDAAAQADLLFPLSLASEGSCTIGGNLASNAGGTQVLRYGTARSLCLGLEVVTAQGEVWNGLTELRKDNTGYALRDLFIGSEGTLGIITAATLKLFSRPAGQVAALVACHDLEAAVGLLHLARARLDAGLTGFEVMHRWPLMLLRRHLPQLAAPLGSLCNATGSDQASTGDDLPEWVVLIDVTHPRSDDAARIDLTTMLEDAMTSGLAANASVAQSGAQHRAMWAVREGVPSAEKMESLMVKHDIAVPTSAIPRFVQHSRQALSQAFPDCRVVCFGHLGDGNLHYNVQAPPDVSAQDFLASHEAAVNTIVYDIALSLGGTLSAEHGIGQLKRDELAQRKSPVALSMMRAIKAALDPQGIMNPGRVL